MGLKDLKSNLDIVGGFGGAQQTSTAQSTIPGASVNNAIPDPNYNTQEGTTNSPFDSNDHLVELLGDSIVFSNNSGVTYDPQQMQGAQPGPPGGDQDLDGLDGPTSQLPTAQASQKHIDSLQSVNQDLDGQPGPQFDLGPSSTLQQDSLLTQVPGGDSNSPFQDLDGVPDPDFNTQQGTVDSPFQSKDGDHMIALLNKQVISTNTGNTYDPAPNKSQFQDLNGLQGPKFDTGDPSKVHADPTQLSPSELVEDYTSTINPIANHGSSTWPVVGAVNQDLNGGDGPAFNGAVPVGNTQTLHTDLLANIYTSAVNPGASFGAGQPGGTYPDILNSPLSSTPFADLDGATPSKYVDNLPG